MFACFKKLGIMDQGVPSGGLLQDKCYFPTLLWYHKICCSFHPCVFVCLLFSNLKGFSMEYLRVDLNRIPCLMTFVIYNFILVDLLVTHYLLRRYFSILFEFGNFTLIVIFGVQIFTFRLWIQVVKLHFMTLTQVVGFNQVFYSSEIGLCLCALK